MKKDFYELTNPQKSIWYTEEVFKGTPIANISAPVIIPQEVNFKLLEKAINILIERADSYRLKFFIQNDKLYQYVDDYSNVPLEIIDVTSDKDLQEKSREIADTPFDNVLNSFLYDFKLIRYPDKHGGFIVRLHHLISDAWSSVFNASEIIKIYSALTKNEDVSTIVYPSYLEYVKSEQEYVQSDKFNKDKTYWTTLFYKVPEIASIPSNTNLLTDVSAGTSERKKFTLSSDLVDSINIFCKNNKISIFNFFMAIFSIYLSRVSSLDEVVVGTPILNRTNAKEKQTSGMFINTIPLKVSLAENISFASLASSISNTLFNMFKHQKYSYMSLLEELRQSNNSVSNLYDIFISYQNVRSSSKISDIPFDINWTHNNYTSDSLDIHIFDMNDSGNFDVAYDYQISKYNESDIMNIHSRILYIINQVLTISDILINDIEILTPEETQKITVDFNKHTLNYDSSKSIKQIFENQVISNPDDIAVVYKDEKLSYKELNEKANMLAHYLIKQNVKKGDIIPVLLNRSTDLIISMMAIIKAGAVYLPISSDFPSERVNYIIEDSKAKLVITSSKTLINVDNISIVSLDTFNYSGNSSKNTDVEISSNDILYIIYTSGSTGNPKGARITNQNLNNFVNNFQNYFGGIDSSDKCLASTNIGFDVSIFEFFTTLLNGATLYLYEENTITDIFKYCKDIVQNNITLLYIPPNILEEVYNILATYPHVSIAKLLIGVEPISSKIMKKYYKLNKDIKIVNAYGPTETTICATAITLDKEILGNYHIIPIGKPLANLKLFILDKNLKPVPISTPGELYITGDNVGKGYLNNKELTENSFVKLPYNLSKNIAYKTGDLAKWNLDGTISFISRKDNQVKINGHRIELGEIENCIYRYPDIEKSIVLVDDKQKIIAYFSSEKNINISDLRVFLQRKLPSYFIPNAFIQVAKFKLTANGKIDKKSLSKVKATQSTYEAPKTDFQKQLAKLFENVLGNSKISINDNFFEIGGDSLSAIKLQIEAFNNNINISYKDIFSYPTIKLLAKHISQVDVPQEATYQDNYDYSKINRLIAKNKDPNKVKLQKEKIKNILLTGATGYMGSHVLDALLKQTRCNIYCLVRGKDKTDPQTRLTDVLRFYFGNKYDKLIFKRIFVIEGDITKPKLGLNDLYYEEVGKSISCVINCAAIVKHYGNSDIFNNINITGTQNIIDFSLKFNCKLMHMSTLSVSGNMLGEGNSSSTTFEKFTEKNLYINQDLSNLYVKTKFIAERLILENILNKNLNAKILRLGNITNRWSDGAFQINVSENAFLNKLHSFLEIGFIPDKFKHLEVEFSPVDLCASSIVNLTLSKNPFTLFHISHNNHISFEKLVKIFNQLGVNLEFVDEEVFSNKVKALSKNPETKNVISGIVNDFDKDKHINYSSNIKMDTTFTVKYLKRLSFKWPKINEKYLRKYVLYLKSIGYINL